jgi:CubicO group peptidase (beta-lactamase class C family)
MAFEAGNDILIAPENIGTAIRKIKKLLRKQKHYEIKLDSAVRRILAAKYDAVWMNKKDIHTDNLVNRIASTRTQLFKQRLYEAAITITHDKQSLLPIHSLESKRIAFITHSDNASSDIFYTYLTKYADVVKITLSKKAGEENAAKDLSSFNIIIAAVFPQDSLDQLLPSLKNLSVNHDVIVCDFGHASFVKYAGDFSAYVTAYASDTDLLRSVPQVIFGGLGAKGMLPWSVSDQLKEGSGVERPSLRRLTYSIPEDAGMDSRRLEKIERIAIEAIQTGATPGCHVLVARDGKVVYEKSFGYLTYDKKIPVTDKTLYDLASVTKVTATLQAVMFMYEKGLIDINKKASYYLPELKKSNKKDFTLKDILTHQAGLWPFLPFWAQTMKESTYLPEFYSREKNDQFPFAVADHLYASVGIRDSLWNWIVKAKVRDKPDRTPFDYRYSDMGFYILQHLSEKLLNQPIDDFLDQNLYGPLGSYTTGYLPLQRFMFDRIAPTEHDKLFRRSLLIGNVHDQGAAMLGGVAGHAGLFSNANDLAKLCQMLLQEGYYGGNQFYKPQTVRLFTQRTFDNSRRGLGWDKPTPGEWGGPTSLYASPRTFGHTGFTGTCIWVDPEFNLVYIFLSNRVHPDMTNNKLINANIRSRIQDVIYESIFNYCQF